MVVQISAPSVTLINQSDPTKTLTLTVDRPSTVTLTSSGIPGVDFSLGGSISLSSTTSDGTYAGTINVTVDY
jgi:spore coat protein U-like protein